MSADRAAKRFSTTGYAADLQTSINRSAIATSDGSDGLASLRSYTEEVRHMLATPRGWSEEERRRYAEKLNRAVIGFPQERAEMLAIISDWIIRKRLQHVSFGNLPYATLAEALFAEVIGMNMLELVLRNREGLEEVQVVGTRIFEVRDGKATASSYRFQELSHVERIQQNLVLFNNDRINPRKRWAEVLLLDGSRVTLTGFGFTAQPTLTIRLYTVKRFNLETLCSPEYLTMDDRVRELLLVIVRSRLNMVVIGATNTGKTHLIKALISAMPDEERIVTIESRYELMLARDFPDKNVVEYESDEDDPLHGPRQAFKLALRQSPQRICHAEIRDEDANIYVRACTRGHEGSITSVHANGLEDVPDTITDMCMLDGRGMNPISMIRRITEHVTHIGFEMRMVQGVRKLVRVGEFEWCNGAVRVRDLVRYDEATGQWTFPESFSDKALRKMARISPEGNRPIGISPSGGSVK
ncbi:ATPase, T2SS/T4P/T4SS family [Cohnella cholangitidis]|uniref:CpaF family protein n=1 Tax=Cohnella cholangitidis TaxID=2598458 RepID=A0A7G5BVQ2_9BACL|nr:ATPase, T2SS/T4P/T4SS family [Cohnella cholangitidis]QMV41036.1 CpaF family protein [Cohnella cholangitidis]